MTRVHDTDCPYSVSIGVVAPRIAFAGHALLWGGYPQSLRPVVAAMRGRRGATPPVPRARERLSSVNALPERGAVPPGLEIRRRAVRPGAVDEWMA